jgi:hypothetical protein
LQKITPNNSNDEEISMDCAGNMDCSSQYTTKTEEDSRRSDTMTFKRFDYKRYKAIAAQASASASAW